MIIISDQFKGISKGIYTTAAICLSLSLLDISSVLAAGIRFDTENKEDVIGAIAIVTAFLTLGAALCLIRDYIATSIADDIPAEELAEAAKVDFTAVQSQNDGRRLRSLAVYDTLSWAVFAIVGFTPIILGIVTCTICWEDMLNFIQNIEVSKT